VTDAGVAARLTGEHRRLDELFGRFLSAAHGGPVEAALEAIREFDDQLRRHTGEEEATVLAPPTGHKLAPPEAEEPAQRLHRELRLEHVQVREISAMIRHLLDEKGDLEGARRLAVNLARRWDAHTEREERELFVLADG
jgi:hypothetical protein